jgi:hypothetical protein
MVQPLATLGPIQALRYPDSIGCALADKTPVGARERRVPGLRRTTSCTAPDMTVYWGRYSPNTSFAMMLRWISLEPA